MTVHDIRHKLNSINRAILLIKEVSTQPHVLTLLDALIAEVCSLGDRLEEK